MSLAPARRSTISIRAARCCKVESRAAKSGRPGIPGSSGPASGTKCIRRPAPGSPAASCPAGPRPWRWWPKAAGLFPDRIMIGFDVAITDRGPVIIEGNVQQGSDMVQRTHELPVGLQRLGELLAWNATQALANRPPAVLAWYEPRKVWSARLRGKLAQKNASKSHRAEQVLREFAHRADPGAEGHGFGAAEEQPVLDVARAAPRPGGGRCRTAPCAGCRRAGRTAPGSRTPACIARRVLARACSAASLSR